MFAIRDYPTTSFSSVFGQQRHGNRRGFTALRTPASYPYHQVQHRSGRQGLPGVAGQVLGHAFGRGFHGRLALAPIGRADFAVLFMEL